ETFSVSISNRFSPGSTLSPTFLYQTRTLPSDTVSPSCGISTSIARSLRGQRAMHGRHDAIDCRQYQIFEIGSRRQRDMRCGDADRRAVEIVEQLLGGDRHQLSAPATEARILLDSEHAVRAGNRSQN